MFHLVHQPHEKQRKSYSRENRCLLPNPLVIKLKDQRDSRKIEKGGVYARLVYENKEDLEPTRKVLDGELVKPLDGECKAQFSLKVNDTSESRKYRILFTIKFMMNGVVYEELVYSSPFSVTSNKRRQFICPKLFDLKPREGLCTEEMEVWIKGRNFTERSSMVVKFGNKVANITETEDNLITCLVPPLPVTEDTLVEVTQEDFDKALKELIPSVSEKELEHYRMVQMKFAQQESQNLERINNKDDNDGGANNDVGVGCSYVKGKGKAE